MEKTVSSFTRQFSSIEGLQKPYTLVYTLDIAEGDCGCQLTLCRTGPCPRVESVWLPIQPETGRRMLQFLCENVVQPEIWRDVLAELCPAAQSVAKGGVELGE